MRLCFSASVRSWGLLERFSRRWLSEVRLDRKEGCRHVRTEASVCSMRPWDARPRAAVLGPVQAVPESAASNRRSEPVAGDGRS